MTLIVHGSSLSPFVRKVCVVLAEKGADYEMKNPPFPLPPEWVEMHPLRRMPVLQDTSRPEPNLIPDSSVICDYLENTLPGPSLIPADTWDRARALWFEEYADAGLFPHFGPGLFRQRVLSRLLGFDCDESSVRETVDVNLPPLFDYLEAQIGDREFLVADAFSIADIAVASPFVNFEHAGERLDAARWPALAGYLERIHARPSFAALIGRERKFLARLSAG